MTNTFIITQSGRKLFNNLLVFKLIKLKYLDVS